MATARQDARAQLKSVLENQLKIARQEVNANKYEFKRLTEKQTILKRKLAEAHKLIKQLEVL